MSLSAEVQRIGGALVPGGVRSARSRWNERHGLLLRLTGDRGDVGLGEASPLPGYSPDSVAACHAALTAIDWAREPEPGKDADPLGALRASPARGALPPAARFAFETAWLDLAGKRLGQPVFRLLGASVPTPYPLCALVTDPSPAALAASVSQMNAHTVKLKIGASAFPRELQRVAAVRDTLGQTGRIRVDANGSWVLGNARERLTALSRFAVEFVEEPVPTEQLMALEHASVPLALDESLQAVRGLERFDSWLRRAPCAAVVLKPMALGGFLRCLTLAAQARTRGLSVTVSHLFDGPVALSAARQLAAAIADARVASGLADHAALGAYPPFEAPALSEPRPPGLGIREVLA